MTEYAKLVVAVDSTQAKQTIDVLIRLDDAGRKVDDTNRKMERSSRSLAGTLARLAGPLAAFLSVRSVIRASDEYGQMAARMRMATSSAEEYTMVQERLIQTAQRTYRPLAEAQELYIRTADALKALGHDTEAALDITDSFSYLLVTNAASAERAGSAINAYSKAIQTGRIDSETWQTLLAAMPTIVDGLADATGRSTQEIRQLGIAGKLSLNALNESLRRTAETNGLLADSMETSVGDAVVTLQNAFNVMIGKVNESTGASSGLIVSLESLAELLQDPDTIQGMADIASGLVTLTSWLIQAATATYGFFDALTDGLAGIRNLTEVQRLEEEIQSIQIELNNIIGDLKSPDWLLSIRGLDRGELERQAKSLELMIKGLKGTLQDMKTEEGIAALGAGLDDVLERLGGFREGAKSLGLVGAAAEEADKAAKRLASSYGSALASLQRQVALYGDTTESARVLYELEHGALKGIAGQQAQRLKDLAAELDAKRDLTEQERRRIEILRESGQLRAANDAQFELEYAAKIAEYERQGNQEALQRLETLRRIREIQLAADQAPGTMEGVSRAPQSGGLDAAVGGAGSELIRLQLEAQEIERWRATELEKQRAFLEAKAINEQTHAERVANIHQQAADAVARIQGSQTIATMSMAQGLSNNLLSLLQQAGQENTALYKAVFLAQQALAVGQAIISTELAAVAAMAPPPMGLGPVAGLPYANLVRGLGYASVALIGAQTAAGLTGMLHAGIDYVPREGTWLLDKGERVVDRRTNADLKEYLAGRSQGGGGSGGVVIHAPVTVEAQPGASNEDAQQYGRELAGAMTATILSTIEKESRPGGLLWNLYGGGR